MIWIVTLCLLALFAWFLFNALNEKRWVEAHSHDEAVAADQGFLPSFSSMKAAVTPDGDGKLSIAQENTRLSRAVAKVQQKTAKVSDYIEGKAAEARGDGSRVSSVRDDDSFFGRTAAKVAGLSESVGSKLDKRTKRAGGRSTQDPNETGAPVSTDDTLFGRAVARVAEKNESLEQRAAERARRRAEQGRDGETASDDGREPGLFDRMVDRVGAQSARLDAKLDAKAQRARESGEGGGLASDDDFMSRVSAKVGGRINEADERIVEKSREFVNRDQGAAGGGTPRTVTSAPAGGSPQAVSSAPAPDPAPAPETTPKATPKSAGGTPSKD